MQSTQIQTTDVLIIGGGLAGERCAIEAATANGPETLGPQAPRTGQLVAGYDADVIALDADPFGDPAIWGDPGRVTHVWQAGRRLK